MNQPLFGTHPVELGLSGREEVVLKALQQDSIYTNLFHQAYPNEPTFTIHHLKESLEQFCYSIVSYQSRYDKGELNELERRGQTLFFSDSLQCARCHGGFNFSTPTEVDANSNPRHHFNTGLYNTDGCGAYPERDQGLFEKTNEPEDQGCFRVPTLRNLAFTAPYYHDGSANTLTEVLQNYNNGGRNNGEHGGNGQTNSHKSPLIRPFHLSPTEQRDLLNFLLSLTDSTLLTNPQYQNPF